MQEDIVKVFKTELGVSLSQLSWFVKKAIMVDLGKKIAINTPTT